MNQISKFEELEWEKSLKITKYRGLYRIELGRSKVSTRFTDKNIVLIPTPIMVGGEKNL